MKPVCLNSYIRKEKSQGEWALDGKEKPRQVPQEALKPQFSEHGDF